MNDFLCLIICKSSGREIIDYKLKADNDYYAKHQAADKFSKAQRYVKSLRIYKDNWYADACEI